MVVGLGKTWLIDFDMEMKNKMSLAAGPRIGHMTMSPWRPGNCFMHICVYIKYIQNKNIYYFLLCCIHIADKHQANNFMLQYKG